MRIRFLLVVQLLIASAVYCQNSLPVQFLNQPSRNAQVATFLRGRTLYGALNDLLSCFHIQSTAHSGTRQLEFKANNCVVMVTATSPYVAITDKDSTISSVQLPQDVLFGASQIFVPLESFVPVLSTVTGKNITFKSDEKRIVVEDLAAASPYDITGLSVEQKSNGALVHIRCKKTLKDYESWVKPEAHETWLYVTIANAKADTTAIAAIRPSGIMKQIMVFQSPTSVQFTIKLKGKFTGTEPSPAEGSNDILIALPTPPPEKNDDVERSLDRERSKWKLDCIVIDAGHGGDDPGTIGVARTKEKDITLAIALKLGKLIEKNLPHTKVVYTRKTDEFIELYRRGQIANEAQGKLFISIHCNSAPRKPAPANGFEIYLLRPGKTENAVRIAERENDVVKLEKNYEQRYQELNEERFILITMAQSAYVKYSEQFAGILQQEMGRYLKQENNGVKQAGFYVLVGASMPNVLIETGYLSNRREEQALRSAKGQQHIAEAIFNAVKRYKQGYEKSLEEGKDMETPD
jgi:N-acetylmuramoyl-L-alanine amidase